MERRRLGGSALEVSVLGLGCNNFGRTVDEATTRAIVSAAIDRGINFVDCADWYFGELGFAEEMIGAAVKGRRDEVVIASKFGLDMNGHNGERGQPRGSREYVRLSVEASLRRLDTDYIDLYQYHYPDGVTPMDETLTALDELMHEGKIRAAGSANLRPWEIVAAELTAVHGGVAGFVSTQNRYNLLERSIESDLIPACQHVDVALIAFFPLANGMLTGKYRRGEQAPPGSRLAREPELRDDALFDTIEALDRFAGERGVELLEIALGGLAAQPGVACLIAGATSVQQIERNAAAVGWRPTEADRAELDRISPACRPVRLDAT